MKKYLTFIAIVLCSYGYGQVPHTGAYPKVWKDTIIDNLYIDTTSIPGKRLIRRMRDSALVLDVTNARYADTFYIERKVVRKVDKKTGQVFYGMAGIKNDSTKIYYKRYLTLKKRGIPDSSNKYKLLLDKNKKP